MTQAVRNNAINFKLKHWLFFFSLPIARLPTADKSRELMKQRMRQKEGRKTVGSVKTIMADKIDFNPTGMLFFH